MFRTFAPALVSLLLALPGRAQAPSTQPALLEELPLTRVGASGPDLQVAARCPLPVDRASRLMLADGLDPVGICIQRAGPEGGLLFERALAASTATQIRQPRGWLIERNLAARCFDQWPRGGGLYAGIEAIGPGMRAAWIDAGSSSGLSVGMSLWLRTAGQPVARLDLHLVDEQLSYGSLRPLVSDLRLSEGERAALWPSPGARRDGRAVSAVSFIDAPGQKPVAWIPIPPRVSVPADPQLEFSRRGRYLGRATVERQDDLFWYAPIPRQDMSEELRVGDDVIVRTTADIAANRFSARLTERTDDGWLINAGEQDRLGTGTTGTVYRDGVANGSIVVSRVQGAFALVAAVDPATREDLRIDDEIRFGPPPPPPRLIGTIDTVRDQVCFAARLTASDAPLRIPLAIRAGGQTVGVALLADAEGDMAVGFALDCSLLQGLSLGMELYADAPQSP